MDAIFPALIGGGLYLMYYAWESHTKGTAPHPIKKITSAIQGVAYSEEPSLSATANVGGQPTGTPANPSGPNPTFYTPNPAGGSYPTGAQ
jgi:hypothetical protein